MYRLSWDDGKEQTVGFLAWYRYYREEEVFDDDDDYPECYQGLLVVVP
jgi:hypothetical protein